jgi:hypothetical protein
MSRYSPQELFAGIGRRAIVKGTADPARARAVLARYVGV